MGGVGGCREWVVQLDSLPNKGTEVAFKFSGCGHLDDTLRSLALPKALISKEQEALGPTVVLLWDDDPATTGHAKLVLVERIAGWQEKFPRVEVLISQEVPRRAVKIICPSFGDYVDDSSRNATE